MIKISVCIPTYNYGRFVGAAIESVLRQTEQDFEIIVADNASDDDTERIVTQRAGVDSRIRYVRNVTNIGLVGNWNLCLELARGRYVKFLCADDLLEERCLERLGTLLESNSRVVLAACARRIVTGTDMSQARVVAFSRKQELLDGHDAIRRCVAAGNIIGEPSAVMFRRDAISGGFDPSYTQFIDLEMWLRILEHGMFAFTPEALCLFRQHDANETKKSLVSKVSYEEDVRLYRAYLNKPHIPVGIVDRVTGYLLRAWSRCPLNRPTIR